MKKSEAVFALAKFISPSFNDEKALQELLQSVKDEWEIIIQQANRYLLVPALYVSLKEKNIYDMLEDEMLKGYLYEIYTLNKKRNEAILFQVQELSLELSTIGVTPLLLKGVTALSEHHFSDDGQRSMMDIDIVVPEVKIFEAITLLKSIGYQEINPLQKLSKHWHHYRRLYKTEGATSVELHRLISKYKVLKYMLNFNDLKDTQSAMGIDNAKVLSPTYELYYTFLHSEIGHDYHDKIITLRHLHHGAVLITKYTDMIDFQKIEGYIKKYNLEQVWHEYLWILQKLFFIEIPVSVEPMLTYEAKVCHNLDTEGSMSWIVKMFIVKMRNVFSFETLQFNYEKLQYPYQLFYYIPKRFFYLSYKIVTDKSKRKAIMKSLS